MKKVLLTTTALVMTAGFAAAEVSISGTAQTAISKTTTGNNFLSTHVDMNMVVSGASDNGITMSATIGYDGGRQVDAADFELDAQEASATVGAGADETLNTADDATNQAWTATPSLTIGYAGYTITADQSGVADYYNGDINSGEIGIAGTMGDVAFGVTSSIGAASGQSKSSYSLSYTMGDMTIAVVGSDNADGSVGTDATKATLTYKMGDTTFTASSDDKDGATIETVTSLGISTKLSDEITVSYTAKNTETLNSSIGDDWDAKISYSAGALTASYGTDEDSVSTISASYDLGGGANLFAAIRSGTDAAHATSTDRDFQAVGINFAF